MNAAVMEMQMILHMVNGSVRAIEEAQRGLEIQRQDLANQAEWIEGEIRKAKADFITTHIEGHKGFPCPECP